MDQSPACPEPCIGFDLPTNLGSPLLPQLTQKQETMPELAKRSQKEQQRLTQKIMTVPHLMRRTSLKIFFDPICLPGYSILHHQHLQRNQ
jgi:hypothetical protein